jgi:hypothetical protein
VGGFIKMKMPKPKPKMGDLNEQHMPKLPYKISPDGYYYLEEKGTDMEVPKAKPKAQRRKKGGRIY